jgi:hypothetical protein
LKRLFGKITVTNFFQTIVCNGIYQRKRKHE